jgi:hypothetical protein
MGIHPTQTAIAADAVQVGLALDSKVTVREASPGGQLQPDAAPPAKASASGRVAPITRGRADAVRSACEIAFR